MNYLKLILFASILLLSFSCASTKYQKSGNVLPENFDEEIEFNTIKTVIIIPAEIDGVPKNFLFDTGAEYSAIDRDSVVGTLVTVGGASNRSIKSGSELVKSFKIGNADFQNTNAVNFNMTELKELIPDFGGIMGQPIIDKANWLIDYPNKKLRVSNQDLSDQTFKSIKFKRMAGFPYTYISIDGKEYMVLIDFGSGTEFNLPRESQLAKKLLKKYKFEDNERESYTIGGFQTINEKVGNLPLVKLGDMEFRIINTRIGDLNEPSIGIGFFKEYVIYIDNQKNTYKLKK